MEPAGISHWEYLPSSVVHRPAYPQCSLSCFFFNLFQFFAIFFPLFAFLQEASDGLGWLCHQHEELPLARPPQTIPHHPQIAWKQGRRIPIFFHIV